MIACPTILNLLPGNPDRDAELVAGLDETEESIAAIPADVASRPGADLAPRDLTANVVFRTVGVSGISGCSSTINNSALLACSRASRRSSVAKPVRGRKMRSKRARNA